MYKLWRATRTRRKAYSLLEMIITLMLTSVILLALITLLTTIMNISAVTYNRATIREDMKNFVLEFEKDMRNARRVGKCEGANEDFECEFFTDALYRWQSCERELPDICEADRNNCTQESFDIKITMCKYKLDVNNAPEGDPIVKFDYNYNLEHFGVTTVADEPIDDSPDSESFRRVIAFTAVSSHPSKKFNIKNMVRQSIVSTKNFEVLIRKDSN